MLNAPYQASGQSCIRVHDNIGMKASTANVTRSCLRDTKASRRSILKQDFIAIAESDAYELVIAVQVASIG